MQSVRQHFFLISDSKHVFGLPWMIRRATNSRSKLDLATIMLDLIDKRTSEKREVLYNTFKFYWILH